MSSLLILLLATTSVSVHSQNALNFDVAFEWSNLNFTWPSAEAYRAAVGCGEYIPQNNQFSGIKVYRENVYISLPIALRGAPITLANIPLNASRDSPLLRPYPSWEANVGESCNTLKNVQAVEIDPEGIMWILDGKRNVANYTDCPCKIVLADINDNGRFIHTWIVPNEFCSVSGGWMNDIVLDNHGGGFAYITENSHEDPGLIVYDRRENRGWKLRDRTMYADIPAAHIVVNGGQVNNLLPIDGIALSPVPQNTNQPRTVFFNAVSSYRFYSISTAILRNESTSQGSEWRRQVQYVGYKGDQGNSDGVVIDNRGNYYYGLIPAYAIGRWNINEPFATNASVVFRNRTTCAWVDSFGIGADGRLFVTADNTQIFLNVTAPLQYNNVVKFRVLTAHIGALSYQYS